MTDNLVNNQDDDALSTTQEYLIAGGVILFFGLLYWFLNHGWGTVTEVQSSLSSKVTTQEWHSASDVTMPATTPVPAAQTITSAHTPAPAAHTLTSVSTAESAQPVVASPLATPAPATHPADTAKPTDAVAAITATATPSGAATDAGPVGQPGAAQPAQTAQVQTTQDMAMPAGAKVAATDFETQLRQAMAKPEANQVFIFDKLQFESGSHKITASSDAQLRTVAALLQANPHIRVLIRGHTDETGIPGNNTELSLLRANEVGVALVNLGVDRRRLRIMGMGDAAPIADNATEAGRQLNRRVDLMILP